MTSAQYNASGALAYPEPPNDEHAESAVCGILIVRPELLPAVSLNPEDFYTPDWRELFAAFRRVPRPPRGEPWVMGLFDAGVRATLISGCEWVPSAELLKHVSRVREMSQRRQAIDYAARLAADAWDTRRPFAPPKLRQGGSPAPVWERPAA